MLPSGTAAHLTPVTLELGSYHGKDGFNTFSHYKSIVDKKTWLDLPMKYQPYTKLYDQLIRFFLR